MKSVVSYPDRGVGGSNKYRGNCSPKLIEDILNQWNIKYLSDYMVGSGTTEDVCQRMAVPGTFLDLNRGFDMMSMEIPERAGNIFWHPPYDSIITYSDVMYSAQGVIDQFGFDPRTNDLSRCQNWQEFVKKMNYCCLKQFTSMERGGRMFILMGDVKKRGKLYSMLLDIAKSGSVEQIIIKTQHNCWSDRQIYSGKFVPIVHEYLLVLRKDAAMVFPVQLTRNACCDIRDSVKATWRDIVASIMEDSNGPMPLKAIYQKVEGHKRCALNKDWQAKIRQVLQRYPDFTAVSRGVWAMQRVCA